MQIPKNFIHLLNAPTAATLSVLAKDGSIQSSLVWPDFDGEFIKLNMLADSPKERNILRERKVTLLVADETNSDIYISLRCELHKTTHESAIEHLNDLTYRHTGLDKWYGEVEPNDSDLENRRVIVYLRPIRIYHT